MDPEDIQQRCLRQDRKTIDTILDHLDSQAERVVRGDGSHCGRQHVRRQYRLVIKVELEQPGGTLLRYAVVTRNISQQGIGLLIGQFIYPGSACRVHLVSPHNYSQVVKGRVVRCRYLSGTAALYEVGVHFDEAIAVRPYEENCGEAGPIYILLVDDDPMMSRLVERFLRELRIKLDYVDDGIKAAEAARRQHYDLILMDLEMRPVDGLTVTRTLRREGYVYPIIALTAVDGEKARRDCLAAGCTGYLSKPVSRDVLVQEIHRTVYEPLISSCAKDEEMSELIDEFVASLPEKVRALQAALEAEDWSTLELTVRMLKGQAGGVGFSLLTELAATVEAALQAGAQRPALRENFTELIKACGAARPVHAT